MIPDWLNEENQRERLKLEARGFRLVVTWEGYRVYFGQRFLTGAGLAPGIMPSNEQDSKRRFLGEAVAAAKRARL